MEDTEVKQLISLLESAQLQYEVDDSGTVSIICDPVQLVGLSEETSSSVLAATEVSNTTSIFSQNLEASVVSAKDEKEASGIIASSSVGEKRDEKCEAVKDEDLEKVGDKKNDCAVEQQETCQEEGSQQDAGPQLQLSPTGQYFIRTPDGQFIQVLGSLGEGVDEGLALEEAQVVEEAGSEPSGLVEENNGGVQIFVVGGSSNEDVFLINAPERDIGGDATGSPVSVPSVMLKSSSLLEADEEPTVIGEQTYMVPSVSSSDIIRSSSSHEDDLISLCPQDDNHESLLKDSTKIVRPEVAKSLAQSASTTKSLQMAIASSLSIKDPLLSTSPYSKHYVRLSSKTKPKFPLKMKIPPKSLREGAIIETDRGDMIAQSLSSVAQLEQMGPKGQKSTLQYIASRFGSMVKVLRPADAKKEPEINNICKRFPISTCEDCGATLHSERSLQIHRRRYHEAWEEECFICGTKFLNVQSLRTHIQIVHSKEDTFQCRLCSYKCNVLKGFLRHRRVHEKSQICDKCGKKYISPKPFQEHLRNCKVKDKTESKRKLNCVSSSGNEKETEKEKGECSDADEDNDTEYRRRGRKMRKVDSGTVVAEKGEENNSTSNAVHIKKKSTRNAGDEEDRKHDSEFKIKSKHYYQQIKKMTVEQNFPKNNRTGRDRTHRCYLCFKLFSNASDLDAHKESYHLFKSDRPVRVKTDSTLDEKDEEDVTDSPVTAKDGSCFNGTSEEVLVKEEPIDMVDEYENVTIIVDESLTSARIIKPFCIACKAHTDTDYRKFSKWFNRIPDGDQLEALKKFQQFFPCVFDAKSLLEPWKLCKKCVLLIDKIADMEDKLNSMKYNLMSRLRGRVENQHDGEGHCNSDQNTNMTEGSITGKTNSGVSDVGTDKLEMAGGIGKSLADIEAYMKETCEIMEIIKPQKRPGRPRRHQKEKLTPVLVSDDEETSYMTDVNSEGIVKKEKESTLIDSCDRNELGSMSDGREVCSEVEDPEQQLILKEEPVQNDFEMLINLESVSWNEVTNNTLTSLSALQEDQFLVENSEQIKKDRLNSEMESFSTEVIGKKREGKSEDLHDRDAKKCQTQFLEDYDPNSQNKCEVSNNACPEYSPVSSSLAVLVIDEKNLSKDKAGLKRKKPDMPYTKSVVGLEGTARKDKHKNVDKNADKIPKQKHKVLGKNRSQIREEREKMCYKLEDTKNKPWICSECHKGFSSQRGACDHYAASHKGQNFSCENCPATYVRKRDLIGHYNKVHLNIKPYKCRVPECVEMFSSHGDLYRHLQSSHSIHKDEARFACHLCDATFAKRRYRDAHLPICVSKGSNSSPYKCSMCEKSFKLPNYLQLHLRTIHGWKNEQFFCEICDKLLTDKRNLIIHMKSHMGETKASCDVCGKQFNRKSYLWTHMRVHTNQRPYGCNYCPKWFKQYSTWKNHERTHTGEKPYKCFICEANFSTSSSVTKHVQYAHYNIRDYPCEICKKTFISKPKLDEHTKVHTGEKPYKCHICNRAFNKKNNLRTHLYVHSTNKRYKCKLCGEGFMRRTTIDNHILNCHELELLLGSGTASTNTEKHREGMAVATTPFISIVGTEDVNAEDSYIVIYAEDEEELDNSKELQVTVLGEDGTSSQVGLTSKHVPKSAGCSEIISSVESTSDVLPEVILEEGPSCKRTESITNLISEDVVSTITMQESNDSNITQVMEIDPAHFRLVTSEDTAEPIYP